MIIYKLISQHLKHRDNEDFYELQASDAVHWMEKWGVPFRPGTTVLDLGCGHGIFGACLAKRGCNVVFSDEANTLMPALAGSRYITCNLDQDDLSKLGTFDVVICSNVYEHLSKPDRFLENMAKVLKPGGFLFLSWTNWLSPWGGHEFSPFHYLGANHGHLIYDKIFKRPRYHTPYQNLFPTYIGQTLKKIRRTSNLRVLRAFPRYYPEFSLIMKIPLLREFVGWNCAMIIQKRQT
ncbi:MAG TPA: methyltransferase domain-containing protein [Verrucomicrobiae bacterium]|jgi:SAM-dependent methyltransferase|nr:methyltransferase domain-containing protein [Verrucomicrobiae bacterium]